MKAEPFLDDRQPKIDHGYNLNDRPENYVGKRRASDKPLGDETRANIESSEPVVYLGIEHVEGLGDSVITASLSFKTAVEEVQEFSSRVEGQEIFPEREYLPSAGPVKMRKESGEATPYRVEPVDLL